MKRLVERIAWACFCLVAVTGCVPTGGGSSMTATRDTVIITAMKFQPAELYINKGDTVVWVNEDLVSHDVTGYPDKAWRSDTISPGESWQIVIDKSNDYFCSIHPTMKAKIIVRE